MSITLPTLDELETWWEAHPETCAITCDETACLIAMPLHERFPDSIVRVFPSRVLDNGQCRGGVVRVLPLAAITGWEAALPDDLNNLAKEFDALAREWDDNDNEMDEQQSIDAADCLALIHEIKEAK